MLRCHCSPVSAILFLLTPIAAYAQTTPAQTVPTIRESVVVTATGREMPESKVGASITGTRPRTDRTAACGEHDRSPQDDARRRRGADGRRRQPDRCVRAGR